MSRIVKKDTRKVTNVLPPEREPCHESLAICEDLVSNDLLDQVIWFLRRQSLNKRIPAVTNKYVQENAFKILNKKLEKPDPWPTGVQYLK